MHCTRLDGALATRAPRADLPAARRSSGFAALLAAVAFLALLVSPSAAFAAQAAEPGDAPAGVSASGDLSQQALVSLISKATGAGEQVRVAAEEARTARDRVLAYDPALIAAVGNQQSSGHWGCCPCFSCAYGDAIIYGVANSHTQYGCRMCTWPGWGGGNSSFRSLGSDQALLREAYDSIAAGKPTVIHLSGASGQHWVCVIGYQNVADPDNLTLDNFIALDPVDGAQITISSRYRLYGDHCEHVSDAL